MKLSENILSEFNENHKKVFVYQTPLAFFIQTQMAKGNCHATGFAVAHTIENSKVMTFWERNRKIEKKFLEHTVTVKDEHIIDGAMKEIVAREGRELVWESKKEKLRTIEQFKKEEKFARNILEIHPNIVSFLQDGDENAVVTKAKGYAYLFLKIDQLNASSEVKEKLVKSLLQGQGHLEKVIEGIVKDLSSKTIAIGDKKMNSLFKHSYLFDNSGKRIEDKDVNLFKCF